MVVGLSSNPQWLAKRQPMIRAKHKFKQNHRAKLTGGEIHVNGRSAQANIGDRGRDRQ